MRSPVIKPTAGTSQLTLDFEPGLIETYACLRDVIASGVYRRGLGSVAIDLDKAPGNLSVELSADPARKFGVDDLERYIEKKGDFTPIYYLCEKFLSQKPHGAADAKKARALRLLADVLPELQQAGLI